MICALEPGAGRAIGRERLADLGHGFVTQLQHRSRRPAHDPAHCHHHREAALLRRADRGGDELGIKRSDMDPPYRQSPQFKEMLRRLVNGRSQFRSHPGMECGSGLSVGHCGYWPTDRRRRGHLGGALNTAMGGWEH